MKSKNLLVNLIKTIVIGLVIFILSITTAFDKLDYRLYDQILHMKNDPEMSDQIAVIAIDDADINKLGEWPWSRDILADTIINLKEMNPKAVVFDIEYISPSKLALAKNSLQKINEKIDNTYDISQQIVDAVIQYAQYGTSEEDINKIKTDLVDEALMPVFCELSQVVENNIAYDNDEYFGKAIEYFGNTFLTINNVDLEYDCTPEEIDYIKDRLLYLDVTDKENKIIKDNQYTFINTYKDTEKKGFTPTMHSLVTHSKGLGFTNSDIDSDGVRRRIELLYEYDGKYYAQLVLQPLLYIFDTNKLVRKSNSLIIKDALIPGTNKRKNIEIPLDSHGRMLINWQHETSEDKIFTEEYREIVGIPTSGVQDIYRLSTLEDNIDYYISNLLAYTVFDEDGNPFDYWSELNDFSTISKQLIAKKQKLLDQCQGFDVNNNPLVNFAEEELENYDDYISLKNDFYNELDAFINGDSVDFIKSVLLTGEDDDEELINFCASYEDLFGHLKLNINEYLNAKRYLTKNLENRLCLIGMTATSTTDLGAVPFEKQYANVYIHANVANTIITGNFITPINWIYSFIVTAIVMLILCLFAEKSSTFQNIFGGVIRVGLIIIAFILPVWFNIYVPFVGSVIFFSLIDYFVGIIYRYLLSSKEKKYVTEIASSFANKDTVEQLRKNPELFNTVGEKKNIIALFSDVQKFSTLSESIEKIYGEQAPMKLCEILNAYLGEMSNQILKNNGTIDKYEGDAIIAMFGAPDPMKIHSYEDWAYLALDSAIKMKKAEVEFNKNNPELFEPHEIINKNGEKEIVQLKPLQTRIGLNAGSAYTGLMGSKTDSFTKLNYTMMGDTVNLASRLEGGNKPYGTWIMCSEETWKLADSGENSGKIISRKVDKIRVVGRNTPVAIYNILGFSDELSELKINNAKLFNNAIELYFNKNFNDALKIFTTIQESDKEDPTPGVFIKRCQNFLKEGVPENWDGVCNLTEK